MRASGVPISEQGPQPETFTPARHPEDAMSSTPGSNVAPMTVKLVGAKSDAVRLLRVHVERGRSLRSSTPTSRQHVDELRARKDEWVADTIELLRRIFDAPTVADGFAETGGRFANYPAEMPAAGETFTEEIELRINRLLTVLKRIESTNDTPAAPAPVRDPAAIVSPPAAATPTPAVTSPAIAKAVLVVANGVDAKFTESVGEFLGRLGLSPTVQVREPGKPAELSLDTGAGFAVMILPREDADHARPDSQTPLRSDVAFDLGFLCGRVGTSRIAVLFPQGADGFNCPRQIPHIPLDSAGGWMLHLARQMRKSGVEVDLNRVL